MEPIKITFPKPLTKAVFVERPNRFIIHCMLEETNEIVVVHLADPGRLKELLLPGNNVWLLHNDNPNRKTRWTAVLCESPSKKGYVSINTTFPNQLVEKVLKENRLDEFNGWRYKKSEFKLGVSRWDFLLENKEGKQLLLEVKSVTLGENGIGMFPDAVTARGTKHVKELISIAKQGEFETAILFVAQREDLHKITTASHIDPLFSKTLYEANNSGVQIYSRSCRIALDGISLGDKLPVIF